jgi:CheY-like chemotaxis protein
MSNLILLIEGHQENRRILSRYLEFVGARTLGAGSGAVGLRLAAEHSPDLILLDMEMPGDDGWAVMAKLQTHPVSSGIPVVALTEPQRESEKLEAAGFCGYLEKPLIPFVVLEEVERCLGPVQSEREQRTFSFPADS